MTGLVGAPTRRGVVCGLAAATTAHGAAGASNRAVRLLVRYNGWDELRPWGEALSWRLALWWPIMTARLASPGYAAPDVVRLSFIAVTPDLVARLSGTPLYRRLGVHAAGVAAVTHGSTIQVNAPFVLARLGDPDMFGMMAHELTHVVQGYPHGATTWLAEGIADYIRFYVLFPDDPRRRFSPRVQSFDSGYQATAGLLDWVERDRPGAVRQVNADLRRGGNGVAVLQDVCGARPARLWDAYLASGPAAVWGD